jgi:hypothetical protein
MSGDIAGQGIVWTASCCKKCCTIWALHCMWPSVVVHEHWPVSQHMIVEMGDYAWSEHIVTVFFGLSDIQVQLTVKGKTTPDSYTPNPKSSCAQNVVVLKWSVSLAPNPCTAVSRAQQKTTFIRSVDLSPCANSPPQMIMWPVKSSMAMT